MKLQLISHLIVRTEQALKDGYNVLEDIIHHSLLGQTSPKVLPLSQVEVVQSRVQKVSSADLDTDFSKMQSIVVSDPNDPRLLLIIVNAAAIKTKTTDRCCETSCSVIYCLYNKLKRFIVLNKVEHTYQVPPSSMGLPPNVKPW